jgi:GH25 family lysozyme M1 (1,4-beta-N-acetylmuramidase)
VTLAPALTDEHRSFGIDYAGIDANPPPAHDELRQRKVRFAGIRRSWAWNNGVRIECRPDPTHGRDVEGFRRAGIPTLAYAFPGLQAKAPSQRDQLRVFIDAPGSIKPEVDLLPAFDLEFSGGIARTEQPREKVFAAIREHVLAFHDYFGAWPIIYTGHVDMWDDNGLYGIAARDIEVLGKCPLWIKIAYRLEAGQPLDQRPLYGPLLGARQGNRNDYWRVPEPWTLRASSGRFAAPAAGYWITQFQGDVRARPADPEKKLPSEMGGLRQYDANQFNHLRRDPYAPGADPRISWVQARLAFAFKTTFPQIGVFCEKTEDLLKNFQSDHGLLPDADIGPLTFGRLGWAPDGT